MSDSVAQSRAAAEMAPPLPGKMKVTRQNWLDGAMDLLVSDGVSEVKIIGTRLQASRSSFYWYFKSRKDLLDQLLAEWARTNIGAPLRAAEMPAATITEAVCNFFRSIVGPDGFNHQLDFAVREWARRDGITRAPRRSSEAPVSIPQCRLLRSERFRQLGYG